MVRIHAIPSLPIFRFGSPRLSRADRSAADTRDQPEPWDRHVWSPRFLINHMITPKILRPVVFTPGTAEYSSAVLDVIASFPESRPFDRLVT